MVVLLIERIEYFLINLSLSLARAI
jgi:hypothetical protein